MSNALFLGLYEGIVINVNDPLKVGRVILRVPQVLGDAVTGWSLPSLPTVTVPSVNDRVYVQFVNGDVSRAVYHSEYAVSGSTILPRSITTDNIAAGAITAHEIEAGSITADVIGAHQITTEEMTVVAASDLIPNAGYDEMSKVVPNMPSYWTNYYGFGDPSNWPTTSLDPVNVHKVGNSLKVSMANMDIDLGGRFDTQTLGGWAPANATFAYVTGTPYVYQGGQSLRLTSVSAGAVTLARTSTNVFASGINYVFGVNAEADPSTLTVAITISVQWLDINGIAVGAPIFSDDLGENQTDGVTPNFSQTTLNIIAPTGAVSARITITIGDVNMPAGAIHYLDSITCTKVQSGGILSDVVPVTPGEWVLTTFWVKASEVTQDTVGAGLWFGTDPNFQPNFVSASYPAVWHPFTDSIDPTSGLTDDGTLGFSTDWTKVTGRTQVPNGMTYMRMTIGTRPGTFASSYTAWIDDGHVTNDATGNVQSADYVIGSSGWALNDDGSASQVGDLNVLGNLGTAALTVAGAINQSSSATYIDSSGNVQNNYDADGNLIVPGYGGDWLDADIITARTIMVGPGYLGSDTSQNQPLEISDYVASLGYAQAQAYATLNSGVNSIAIGATQTSVFYGNMGSVKKGFMYRVKVKAIFIVTNPDNGHFTFNLKYTNDGSTPNALTGAILGGGAPTPCGADRFTLEMEEIYQPTNNFNTIKIALLTSRQAGAATVALLGNEIFMTFEEIGPQVTPVGVLAQVNKDTGGDDPSPIAPPTQTRKTHTATFSPIWFMSYDGGGNKRLGGTGGYCYQGYFSGNHGNQKSIIAYNSMAPLLSGATVKSIVVNFRCFHTYFFSGARAIIGYHTSSAGIPPNQYPGHVSLTSRAGCVAGGNYSVALPSSCFDNFRSGNARGITFGPGTNNAQGYYAYFGSGPTLTVTYVK